MCVLGQSHHVVKHLRPEKVSADYFSSPPRCGGGVGVGLEGVREGNILLFGGRNSHQESLHVGHPPCISSAGVP